MATLRGKSLLAISRDIADGYITINPLFLKPLDRETLEELSKQIVRLQIEIRGEKFPYGDVYAIRQRNIRLQRLHSALIIIKNFAKERGMRGFTI
ncbi:MAG: hypothetical protein Fur0020_13420 [Thermodesulfovibrionia bacterium]